MPDWQAFAPRPDRAGRFQRFASQFAGNVKVNRDHLAGSLGLLAGAHLRSVTTRNPMAHASSQAHK
ncbi:MAG: hypothetical protein H6648_07750 [Caldilineae bacterium]|nr:hypothetical protein [Caldilineae bacterium]